MLEETSLTSEGRSCGSLCSRAVHPLCCVIYFVFRPSVKGCCGILWRQVVLTGHDMLVFLVVVQVVTVMFACNVLNHSVVCHEY